MKDKKLIIKDIQGEIYVISQDGSIKMLKDGDEIYAGEKIFTKNLDAKITLEDGEQVNLNAHQSINLDEILKISAKTAEEQSDHSNGFGASEGISLSAASFITSGHSANIHQIYNQHRSLEPNVSSAQPSELKSISGASSTLIEKSSTAAGPKEEPFIDTINVLNVTNRGLDANIWLYDSARNGGRLLDYYRLEPSKSIFKEWIANHNVSATSTYDDLRYRVGESYGFSRPANEVSILQDRNIRPEELARMGQDKNIESINKIDRLNNPILSYGRPEKPNGNYRLNESKIVSDGVINIIDGWIYIKDRNSLEYFVLFEKNKRAEVKIEFDGRTILEESFYANTLIEPNSENHKPTEALNLAHDGGFYKIHIEVIDERYNYLFNLMAQEKGKAGHSYLADVAGIKLVSNAYMEALAQKGLVTKESDTFYKAKEINGTKFGDNASDFDKPFDLEFKGTKDVGSNLDDKFIFNSHDIDAKGGIDTLVFTQNVDLTKISELDKRLESFERIELDHTKAVKLKLNGQNISDMIDSNPTEGPDGKVSLNTILKISGDSDDVVQLVGNFIKATKDEVAALNAKNSVIGAGYNKLDEVGGEVVNQVYKGENNAGQTFFVEIDKNVHVEVM
ncbi:hypothetical protein G6W43_06520 [Campylobacter concisus]|uniref:hypothetical protein n=1 Tax=Campylobacter concisus TaxID=199 RepID=UPI001883C152|nr:hypothetical protein [Campylobacter concisus]MBE9856896.1 hypothetical protein [Campylobacter concisus]